jgi:hypothetical protein
MTPLFKKLNYKLHPQIVCINHPDSFNAELEQMQQEATIITQIKKTKEIQFVLCFVTTPIQLQQTIDAIAPKLIGDAVVWMCYPKRSSNLYNAELHRDHSWHPLGHYNLEPVSSVAIDEDWSALRFRNVAYIKTMARKSGALSKDGQKRIEKNG